MAEPSSTPARRPSKKRDAIVEAARALFCSEGYPGTSMDAVAAGAGVSKATLYAHFPSKADLFQEVISTIAAPYVRVSSEVLELPVADGLRVLGRSFLDLILSPQAVGSYRVLVAQGTQFPEMVETYMVSGPRPVIGALAAYLAQQHQRGTLRVPDPPLAASLFLHMVKGEVHGHVLMGLPFPDTDLDRVLDEAVRIMLAAYAP
ncbi:TetR/AcrR family transcriptional regulator [Novispirillum sp. DQ9]|uniref:TetR/AcrR family transcriptional regulator n=1 Tax=Novispirillum sp. DQ9 TaxID=3398612 RepID=UPI003C7CE499